MTRYFILAASFLFLFSCSFTYATASESPAMENIPATTKESGNTGKNNTAKQGKHTPASHGAKSSMPVEKHHTHVPTMDETPHIHRFHKERVKKVIKHHTKIWYLSMFLIAVCQVSLLFIAYLHLTH